MLVLHEQLYTNLLQTYLKRIIYRSFATGDLSDDFEIYFFTLILCQNY